MLLPMAQTFSTRPPLARMRPSSAAFVPAWKISTPSTLRRIHSRPVDDRAFRIVARIALRGHHHGERGVVIPAQIERLQHAVAGRKQRRHEVRHQAQHQHLRLGIAEARVVFDQLRTVLRDHEAGEQHALVTAHPSAIARSVGSMISLIVRARHLAASSPAPANTRPCRRCSVPCRRRRRACGPAPRPAAIAVVTVAQREERGFLAFQEFLDHDLCAGSAPSPPFEHHIDGGFSAWSSVSPPPRPCRRPDRPPSPRSARRACAHSPSQAVRIAVKRS
jgi:hypothetical protein